LIDEDKNCLKGFILSWDKAKFKKRGLNGLKDTFA
jgi:hypothetical protein